MEDENDELYFLQSLTRTKCMPNLTVLMTSAPAMTKVIVIVTGVTSELVR